MVPFYSLNNERPAPLPFRIYMPDGSTRTDPESFSAEEIEAAGFVGPITIPEYDPETQALDWDGDEYVIVEVSSH